MRITCQFYAQCTKLYNRYAGYKFFFRGNISFLHSVEIYKVSQEERSILWEAIVSVIPNKKVCMYMCPIPRSSYFTVQYCTAHCTDEQHAMSSHELQSALRSTEEFSKIYCHLNNKCRYQKQYVISLSYQQFWNCTAKQLYLVNRSE
jgi:hypothetical protein